MPRVRVAVAVLALVLTAVAVYVGTRAAPDGASTSAAPSVSPSVPVAEADLSGRVVERRALCDRIATADVEDALGGPVVRTAHYDSGDRATLAPGLRDVSHEFDCTYLAADGTQARLWVFAQPVGRSQAGRLARQAGRVPACRELGAGPTFGDPHSATTCRTKRGRAVTLHGLFGDAWLSCQLTVPRSAADRATRRAQELCVRAVLALSA